MVRFFAVLLRSAIAVFVGVLFAGGTLTLAAERVPVARPTLVPVGPEEGTIVVPDVQGQPYVFAKSILQDYGLAWHVTGPVQGFAANTVTLQRPTPGTTVIDTGAPTVTLVLARNTRYLERGTPENDAPYAGTEVRIPATGDDDRPRVTVQPRLQPVPIPTAPPAPGANPAPTTPSVPITPQVPTTPSVPTRPSVPTTPSLPTTPSAPTTPSVPTPKTTAVPRTPDFTVPGAPKEPSKGLSLPDRASDLRTWIETHRQPSAANLNHWLYEHAFIVAGAKFGWFHGAEALQILIEVDKRAEALWGVGSQSRTTAEKALAEVLARRS